MKQLKIFSILVLLITQSFSMTAQTNVPLIDREVFFGNSEVTAGQLSPDGKYISFLKEHDGIMNIWVKNLDESFDNARLLTNSKSPILGFFWTYDGKYILYVNDNNGDENMNIFSVDPSAKAEGEVPPSKNLTPLKEVTAQIYMVSKKDPNILKIGLNDRDKAWHDLYQLEISTGKLTKEFENNDRITGWDFDWDEKPRLAYRTDENGFSEILRVDGPGKFEKIYGTNLKESAYVQAWNKDNTKAYLVSNKGDVNLRTLFLMDPKDGSVEKIESDPENKVDFGGMRINRNTREIMYTAYTLDQTKYYWKDKSFEDSYKFLQSKFPNREIGFNSSTLDYSKYLISLSGDKYATDVYLFDRNTKELTFQYTPKPKLKEVEQYLSEMKPISYKSRDGLVIPAYLTVPYGKEAKDLPLVALIHGGPKGPRDYWGYDPTAQFLANRGYAVLQPNFRASGGFGKEFLNAGDKQWGRLMQDDITFGVNHLIEQGIVAKDKVAIMGGSYGGYATLAGLAFTPDVYACGVDIVGPSNLFTLLESIPPYWEAGRKWLYEMTGDPNTPEGKALLEATSPLFHADKIVKPLLIIQGANDPRVKKAEADQIVVAMRDRKKDVAYILANDEGHGFRKPLNRKAMYAEVETFLAKYLDGRYQKEIPTEVAEKLKDLTIDINTVKHEVANKVEALQKMPAITPNFVAGTSEYDVNMNMGGNDMKMSLTRSVEMKDGKWIVTETTKAPQGNAVDQVTYNADYSVSKRNINQGGMEIPVNYDGNKANVSMMGRDINIEADGMIMSDGPGVDLIFAGMNMKEGESISYYVADFMTAKAKQMTLTHLGTEKVDGKDCTKLEVRSVENENEKTTYWIDNTTKSSVKYIANMPAFNNAVMTVTKK